VVVIGAGAGGMAVALRLAVRRHQVTVVEAADRPGGKLSGYRRDGFVFDTGPSLLTLPAVYRELFGRTGAALDDVLDLVQPEPGYGYRFADGTTVDLPSADPGRCAAALGQALGGSAEADWRALIARAGRMWQVTRRPFLESPVAGPRQLLSMVRRPSEVRTVAPWQTLRSLGSRALADARLRQLLDRYATFTGSDPRRAPAALATVPYVEQTFGIHHVAGGLHRLGAALHERSRERGAAFRFGEPVQQVLLTAGRVSGVRLASGERLTADVVVSDADAARLYGELLPEAVARQPLRRLRRTTPSLSAFVLLLAVRGRTPGLRHHNVWFPADYDAEFDSVFGPDAGPVEDPTVYVCAPDDAAMRPDAEHEAWSVLVNAPRHSTTPARGAVDWAATGLADRYRDHVLAVMAAHGFDVRDRLLWSVVRTPADLERDTGAPGGAIYGSSSNGARAAFLRPANASPIPGLFLVGGSAHPGGGLPLVGISAQIVADLVGRP
jgi:phytoene desaturase